MESRPLEPVSQSVERALIIGLILLGWALILVFRLFDLQVMAHDDLAKRARRQQQKLELVEAPRGSIFDRNGNLLAISSPSHFVVVDPKRIPDKATAAALLAGVLSIDPKRLQAALETAAASKRHNGYFVVDQHVTEDQAATLRDMKLEWLEIRQGSLRSYPNGDVAAHVIGNLNAAGQGVAGVELKLNKELRGTPGEIRVEQDGKEDSYSSEVVKEAAPGNDIGLTIDRQLQYIAKETLRDAVVKNHADHGSLIAMNPNTGEILALENYPTYDLNERLLPGEKPTGREDLAVVAPFEPGSVFKVVTLSAALETTDLRPDSIINCGNGSIKIFSRVVHDHKSYSVLPMRDVLAYSSNVGAIRIGMQVGYKNLYEYIRRFGFGSRTGIELPAEAPGLLRPLKRWQPTTIGSIPMGHELAVTSVQLAQAGSVIANGGFLVHPTIVAWERSHDGVKHSFKPPDPPRVLRPKTVALMRSMMRSVVTEEEGTGHHIHVPGYAFAGKTGTAQIYDYAHHIYTHRYNASFIGFAPLESPSVIVVVTISGTTGIAGYGGQAAGPVFENVMQTAMQRLGIARDQPEDIDELMAKEKAASKDKTRSKERDDVALAELNPPTAQEMQQASGDTASEQLVAADSDAPKAPNFVGKTVKDVIEEATATGIEVDLFGDGMARAQSPMAGAVLLPGEHIAVRFAR
jgi:cell division protein FtsI (penicillin-binding protein 3)